MQARYGLPLTITVQEPHWPSWQQTLQPVSIICSRNTSASFSVFFSDDPTVHAVYVQGYSLHFSLSSKLRGYKIALFHALGLLRCNATVLRILLLLFLLDAPHLCHFKHVAHERAGRRRIADAGNHLRGDGYGDFLGGGRPRRYPDRRAREPARIALVRRLGPEAL